MKLTSLECVLRRGGQEGSQNSIVEPLTVRWSHGWAQDARELQLKHHMSSLQYTYGGGGYCHPNLQMRKLRPRNWSHVLITTQPLTAELGWNQACLTQTTGKVQARQDPDTFQSYAPLLPDKGYNCRILSFPFFWVLSSQFSQNELKMCPRATETLQLAPPAGLWVNVSSPTILLQAQHHQRAQIPELVHKDHHPRLPGLWTQTVPPLALIPGLRGTHRRLSK